MDEARKELFRKRIKDIFFENFRRELSLIEVETMLNDMLLRTKEELSKIPDFKESDYEKYFATDEIQIVFSPRQINHEIHSIIQKIGIDELETSKKYKRLSEMNNAACLALALKKSTGEEWVVKGQDNPDILLISRSGQGFREKPFRAINLEVMQVPQQSKDKMNQSSVEVDVAQFIKEKKFLKRYGPYPHLIVHLDFNHMGFKLETLSEEIRKLPGNPFHQVWIRATTDPTFSTMVLTQIYPDFFTVKFDVRKDISLYF